MDEDEIFFDSNAEFKIHPVSEDYTHQRIKRILKNDFNCHLENIWQGYKANRRPGYHEIYNLVDNATGKIIGRRLPLDHFRREFTRMGYPLDDEKSAVHGRFPQRKKGIERFRETVERAKKESQEEDQEESS